MKKLLSLAILQFLAVVVFAQNSAKDTVGKAVNTSSKSTASSKAKKPPEKPKPIVIPTPEFINQPYYYDKNDNRLIRLENATASKSTKKKTLGLKGAKEMLTLEGGSSKVRFTSKTNISFIIKTSGDVIDLTSYIKLYKFSVDGEAREVLISAKEGLINNKDEQAGKLIGLSIKPLSKDNYMITLPESLEAGEYGFVWVKNMELKEFTVHAFGIDWRSSD